MGFIEDIEKIVAATPDSRQTMLFSATLDGVVGNMARRITKDPMVIQIASATKRHENIEQRVHFVDDLSHKNKLLDHVLRDEALDQAVVFTATKRDADTIADRLNIAGFAAAALHGDMNQGARNRTLNGLRRGDVRVLVATDVAARGIDVPNITHVVNYDLPKFAEDYVHRIGRTGRAGRNGLAISLVNHAESQQVRRIERFTKQTIPVDVVEGLEPKRAVAPRSATRPGWKPGDNRDNRYGKKPGQRSFGQGDARGDGQRSFGPGAPRGDSQRSFGPGAPRREGEGYARPASGFRSGEGYNRPNDSQRAGEGYNRPNTGFRAGEGQPRSNEGFRSGERSARPADNRSGGYKGAHPRSTDSARRTFGDY
jgi:superfamily II DNA/RNA helicase